MSVASMIAELRARVSAVPLVRWGTVTQVNPVRVLLDGPNETELPYAPAHLGSLHDGARVLVMSLVGHHVILGARKAGAYSAVIAVTGDGTATATGSVGYPAGWFDAEPVLNATSTMVGYHATVGVGGPLGHFVTVERLNGNSWGGTVYVHCTAHPATTGG